MQSDWVGILETIYDSEPSVDAWKQALAHAARPCMPYENTTVLYTFDASDPARFTHSRATFSGNEALAAMMFDRTMAVPLSPEYVTQTFRRMRAATLLETIPVGAPIADSADYKAMTGFAEAHIANGIDADGHGLWMGAMLDEYAPLPSEQRQVLEQLAAHLATGWRLRRRLASAAKSAMESAEAVLTPEGRVQHAVGPAALDDSREALSEAARAIDRARTRAHRADPSLGLTEWRGLVARRWSLLEVFERDGKRFLIAQENKVPARPHASLTPREHEVAALVALGLSNKLVAYELGITAATVGVLLHRARKKLDITEADSLREVLAARALER